MQTRIALLASSLLLLVTAAPVAQAEGFVGASVGRADWKEDCSSSAFVSCDVRDTGGTLRAGYRFSPYWGVEGRYIDLGKVSARSISSISIPAGTPLSFATTEYQGTGGGLDVFVSWPITERFSISGMAGVARMKSKSRFAIDNFAGTGGTNAFTASRSDNETYYGLGLSYALTQALAITLEAERYRVPLDFGDAKIDFLAAGLTYRF